ncbi:beta-galactosidase [Echinicola sediminis]
MFNTLKNPLTLVLALLASTMMSCQSAPEKLSLEGNWVVVLDSLDQGESEKWFKELPEGTSIKLPGTLDMAGLGQENSLEPGMNNYVLSHLARKNQYIGKAWYHREVDLPKEWIGRPLILNLERVMWASKVWINGELLGTQESLVGPHQYEVKDELKAGKNSIVLCVDNGNQYPYINVAGNKYPEPTSKDMAHGFTNHTQIKWNGVIGEMSLKPQPVLNDIQVYPSEGNNKLAITAKWSNSSATEKVSYKISQKGRTIAEGSLAIEQGSKEFNGMIELEERLQDWNEFHPNVYELELSSGDSKMVRTFGVRNIGRKGGELQLNGKRIFLRGTLECAVFPQTGFPYTDKEAWGDIMKVAKSYGLNHFRFHSWCPPKAAFEAADELGFYIQAELPHWSLEVGEDQGTTRFLEEEAQRILEEYGNHPSFVLMSLGNELEGDMQWLNKETARLKTQDTRRLYTTTTFSFQKGVGQVPQPEDEYFVTQWTDKGWIRGQGIFNAKPPHFDKDYQKEIDHINVPVISHEIGQYSVYPDLSEIEKYQGVLKPLNFMAVKNDLEKKGLLEFSDEFTYASGKLAALLYKEEIERALKTPGFDGFQLLQLQDFPGQGTALVGLLNVFWESKGFINSEEFSEFCNELVPLIRYEKAVYESGETFEAAVEIANFYKPLDGQKITWSIEGNGGVVASGSFENQNIPLGNETRFGMIQQRLNVEKASKLMVKVALEGTSYKNEWPIWVYPDQPARDQEILYTRSLEQAKNWLEDGKSVLLNPEVEKLEGVTGRFVPVFWSPVHFPDQPSTMGILCDPAHPALADFPTEGHTNWQWWDLCIQSKSLVLDGMEVEPVVRVIDNFVTNRKLASIFEAKVGNGKLLFSSIDLAKDLEKRPEARQLRKSLASYMNSVQFDPQSNIIASDLDKLCVQ